MVEEELEYELGRLAYVFGVFRDARACHPSLNPDRFCFQATVWP